MASLLVELHVWSLKNPIAIADGDIGCYTYHDKGEQTVAHHYLEDKQQYTESRDVTWIPKNRRPDKLRDTLKELEELMLSHNCVHIRWKGRKLFQILLSNGVLVTIQISVHSGDIEKLTIDKSLQGKLAADPVNDAIITDSFLMFTYPEKPKATLVYFNKKPSVGETASKKIEKLSTYDPKFSHLDLPGPKGKRLERKLSINTHQEWVVVWWPIAGEEAWPWSPMSSDRDRANIVILGVSAGKLEELCFTRSEYDPIHVAFSSTQSRHVYTLEVGTSAAGEVVVDSCIYECSKTKIQRATVTTIPTKAGITAYGRNKSEDKLVLACDDGKVVLYDEHKRLTQFTQADLEPSVVGWHPGGCVVFVASNRGEIQCFDMALNPLNFMMLSENPKAHPTLHLGNYFRSPTNLSQLHWCQPDRNSTLLEYIPDAIDSQLLIFERGPLAMLQIHLGVMSRGKLGPEHLVRQFLHHGQTDEAVNLLTAMNWNTEGTSCFICLSSIMDHLLRSPLNEDREAALESALGSFYAPPRSLSEVTVIEYRDAISRLARRFFHHLLRYRRFEKAFLLAVDLHSRDLFMDIHYLALDNGEPALAAAAKKKAEDIENEPASSSTDTMDSSVDEFDDQVSLDDGDFSNDSDDEDHKDSADMNDIYLDEAGDVSVPVPGDVYAAVLREDPLTLAARGSGDGNQEQQDDDIDGLGNTKTLKVIHFGLV